MAESSKIQWTDATFNPWRGCTKISAGCANCYAETMSGRNQKTLGVWGPNGTRVVASESMWREPIKWNRLASEGKLPDGTPNTDGHRPRVFCASLADVFEDWNGPMADSNGEKIIADRWGNPIKSGGLVPGDRPLTMQDVRQRLFDLIDQTPHLGWLVLTKRPQNIAKMMPQSRSPLVEFCDDGPVGIRRNLWLGTSVEDQKNADERIPHLLRVPAVVRFLSMEPLIGPVDLSEWLYTIEVQHDGDGNTQEVPCKPPLDWVIVGGESGSGARPMNLSWARSVVSDCQKAGVPVFVKQLGACPVTTQWDDCRPSNPHEVPWTHRDERANRSTGRSLPIVKAGFADKKGGDIAEFPSDLRVRQFPVPFTQESK